MLTKTKLTFMEFHENTAKLSVVWIDLVKILKHDFFHKR